MNYEKIGTFIGKRRKALHMTQKYLAEQLHLTDRAISRWERGVGCPDISILEPLADLLQVSVLELLHGETITCENHAVVTLLSKERKRLKLWRNMVLLGINILGVIFCICFLLLYWIPQKTVIHPDYQLISIVSPSMEPEIHMSDKILVQKVDFSSIQVGDIISYFTEEYPNFPITHRVVNKYIYDDGKIKFKTKGDTNYLEDSYFVFEEQFIGILRYRYAYLGSIIPNQPVSLTLALLFLCGMISTILFDYLFFKKCR